MAQHILVECGDTDAFRVAERVGGLRGVKILAQYGKCGERADQLRAADPADKKACRGCLSLRLDRHIWWRVGEEILCDVRLEGDGERGGVTWHCIVPLLEGVTRQI